MSDRFRGGRLPGVFGWWRVWSRDAWIFGANARRGRRWRSMPRSEERRIEIEWKGADSFVLVLVDGQVRGVAEREFDVIERAGRAVLKSDGGEVVLIGGGEMVGHLRSLGAGGAGDHLPG